MKTPRSRFKALTGLTRTPFGSALLGGLVVGVLGWIAIAAGWVDGDSESGSSAPVAATPLASSGQSGEGGGGTATGSGFVIDRDGNVVTNAHVVEGAEEVEVTLSEDGDSFDAEVVGEDPSTDIAVL